jgi:hypothetical protein
MNAQNAPFINSILYGDIFDFPLTESELWKWAISEKKSSKEDLAKFVKDLPVSVKKTGAYFHLVGREAIVEKRNERLRVSKRKYLLAEKAAKLLAKIPTIRFIGVSGGLAMMNADEGDDIDLFIITEHKAVWMTRLLVFVLLSAEGIGRKRDGRHVKDAICVNMYLDEQDMGFVKNRHDVYTAHEIMQVIPLVDREHTYGKFVTANVWISEFLPNTVKREITQNHAVSRFSLVLHTVLRSSVLEQCAKLLQMWYMRPHRTRETVSDTILAFHPTDYRGDTLKAYDERIKQYEKI